MSGLRSTACDLESAWVPLAVCWPHYKGDLASSSPTPSFRLGFPICLSIATAPDAEPSWDLPSVALPSAVSSQLSALLSGLTTNWPVLPTEECWLLSPSSDCCSALSLSLQLCSRLRCRSLREQVEVLRSQPLMGRLCEAVVVPMPPGLTPASSPPLLGRACLSPCPCPLPPPFTFPPWNSATRDGRDCLALLHATTPFSGVKGTTSLVVFLGVECLRQVGCHIHHHGMDADQSACPFRTASEEHD